jgi:hypothetical protein
MLSASNAGGGDTVLMREVRPLTAAQVERLDQKLRGAIMGPQYALHEHALARAALAHLNIPTEEAP